MLPTNSAWGHSALASAIAAQAASALKGGKVSLGAQDCHAKDSGAFTGDIAAPMIKDAGAQYVIVGHSERRQYHGETDAVVKGLVSAAAGKAAPYELDKIGPQMDAFMQKKQEGFLTKLRSQNMGEAKAFFDKLKDNKNVVELADGLRYEVVQPGTGAYPKATDTVKVHYTGRLINGTVFDTSLQPRQPGAAVEPVEFPLNSVIPGWTEGLQKINQGGKIRLYIPPHLAYGDTGQQGIPPGATLIFDIELLDVKATAPATPVEPKK